MNNVTMRELKQILSDPIAENDMHISKIMGVFYRIKLIICMMLHLSPDVYPDYGDFVRVVYTDGGVYSPPSEPTVHWFSSLAVGYGVFSNWYFFEYSDSD